MKVFILLLVLASTQVFATETETSTTEVETTTEEQVSQTEELPPERVKLETLKVTPARRPASWSGGGRNFR